MRDLILLSGIRIPAAIGVTPEERGLPRLVEIDLELELDLREAGRTDDVSHTVDYAAVFASVEKVTGSGEHRLVEALATRIADTLLANFPIQACTVTLHKPTPIAGSLDRAGVKLRRERR
jgi:dihydroneopterin aldolase